MAWRSYGFSVFSPERTRRFVPGSSRLSAVGSGTSFTQIAIFTFADPPGRYVEADSTAGAPAVPAVSERRRCDTSASATGATRRVPRTSPPARARGRRGGGGGAPAPARAPGAAGQRG